MKSLLIALGCLVALTFMGLSGIERRCRIVNCFVASEEAYFGHVPALLPDDVDS